MGTLPNWPRYPTIYEINTWAWLSELSERSATSVNLSAVPSAEWDAIAAFGFDAVWLMGVWERSPAGAAVADRDQRMLDAFRHALPDFQPQDNIGSAYCVRRYVVDRRLGGPQALAIARRELANRGIRLILDFVPNHLAQDHPWVAEHPEYFISGTADDLRNDAAAFVELNGKIFACGRDPYFPPWQDVLQLNAFHPGVRLASIQTVASIAGQCDGIRCDMAMLFMNQIFQQTWGNRPGQPPDTEYWPELISEIKKIHPNFLFIAEAYWDREWQLQQQGFDFCYDKRFYDRLAQGTAEDVRFHLSSDIGYQAKLLRFIENHDERRAAITFLPGRQRAAAVTMATVPGAKLFHEGQLEGRKVRLPVFLSRRSAEPADGSLGSFYKELLKTIDAPVFQKGEWALCQCTGWPDNASYKNILAWSWLKNNDSYLIVVNFSDNASQARVWISWEWLRGKTWRLFDVLSGETFDRNGDEMHDSGLYVGLPPWGYHFLRMDAL